MNISNYFNSGFYDISDADISMQVLENNIDTSAWKLNFNNSIQILDISYNGLDTGRVSVVNNLNGGDKYNVSDTLQIYFTAPELYAANKGAFICDNSLTINSEITNSGNGYSTPSTLSVYLSADSILSDIDTLITDLEIKYLEPDSIQSIAEILNIGQDILDSMQYVLFSIDRFHLVNELNEENNKMVYAYLSDSTIHQPEINVIGDTLICAGLFAAYQWYNQDGIIEGVNSNKFVINASGIYYLEITTESGCKAMSVEKNLIKTPVNVINLGRLQVSVYPNPNNGKFTLNLKNSRSDNYMIQVFNNLGQLQLQKVIQTEHSNHTEQLNLSNQPKGIYFVKIFNDKFNETKKVIVQ